MNENKKIELLGKLVGMKEISRLMKKKEIEFHSTSIVHSEREKYVNEGWEVEKELKFKLKLRKPKDADIAFEDEVWTLFALMGYKFLNRDRGFHLPYDKNDTNLTKQIDVFAVDDETILIVECKSSINNKRGDFKKELESYQGIMDGLRKSIQAMFPNKKYKIKFILATKNLSLNEEDKTRLTNLKAVHLNEDSIDYFFRLHAQLGTASKYQFLGAIVKT